MIKEPIYQDVALTPKGSQKRRRIVAVGATVAICALAGLVLIQSWRGDAHSVNAERIRIATVTRGELVRDANVNGRIVAASSPTMYAATQATVTLKTKAGDAVHKGDVLAVLDAPELQDQLKREQALCDQIEAEVERARITAEKQKLLAKRDADQAEIERLTAVRNFERYEQAGELGVVSKIEYAKAKDAVQTTQIRSTHAASAALLEDRDAQLQLKTKLSELRRQQATRDMAAYRVEQLTLRSPIDGVVGNVLVADRAAVNVNTPLLTVVDLGRLEVELPLPESYARDIGLGMAVQITTGESTVTARVASISPEVTQNQVMLRARFDKEVPPGLRQSQRVGARILIERKPNVIHVERGSFIEVDGGHFAYVVDGSLARRVPVQLGSSSLTDVEIVSGLKPGDRVVITGTDAFAHADVVQLNHL